MLSNVSREGLDKKARLIKKQTFNEMRRIVMIITFLSVAAFSYAQPQGRGGSEPQMPKPPSVKEIIKQASKELNLSHEQVKEWQAIFKRHGKPSQDDPEKADEMRKAINKELEATLTWEQIEKFREMQKRPPRPDREK